MAEGRNCSSNCAATSCSGRPLLEKLVEDVTGTQPVSVHHDISTATGEEVIVFTLAAVPSVRDKKRR